MPILKFPIIGYSFDAEEVYAGMSPGVSLKIRIGQWPPGIISSYARPHILSIY